MYEYQIALERDEVAEYPEEEAERARASSTKRAALPLSRRVS